jgi:undecaprenyl-diphosphatase
MTRARTDPPPLADTPVNPTPRSAAMGPLVALVLTLALLAGFVLVLVNVLDGDLDGFDQWLVTLLRADDADGQPLGPSWLRVFFVEITHLGGTVALTVATAVVAGLLAFERRYRPALLVLVAVLGGTALSSALKLGLDRPRPDLVPHLVEVLSPSFPSGHAMLSTVVYLTLGLLLARFEFARPATRLYVVGCALGLVLLIGASRVYLGVHWPSDVLAGWCLGAAWAIGCLLAADRLAARRR